MNGGSTGANGDSEVNVTQQTFGVIFKLLEINAKLSVDIYRCQQFYDNYRIYYEALINNKCSRSFANKAEEVINKMQESWQVLVEDYRANQDIITPGQIMDAVDFDDLQSGTNPESMDPEIQMFGKMQALITKLEHDYMFRDRLVEAVILKPDVTRQATCAANNAYPYAELPNKEPFKCHFCTYQCLACKDLVMHAAREHMARYVCLHCNRKFRSETLFKSHYRKRECEVLNSIEDGLPQPATKSSNISRSVAIIRRGASSSSSSAAAPPPSEDASSVEKKPKSVDTKDGPEIRKGSILLSNSNVIKVTKPTNKVPESKVVSSEIISATRMKITTGSDVSSNSKDGDDCDGDDGGGDDVNHNEATGDREDEESGDGGGGESKCPVINISDMLSRLLWKSAGSQSEEYLCAFCLTLHRTRHLLARHLNSDHCDRLAVVKPNPQDLALAGEEPEPGTSTSDDKRCRKCSVEFATRRLLERHMIMFPCASIRQRPYHCKRCNYTFQSAMPFTRHIEQHVFDNFEATMEVNKAILTARDRYKSQLSPSATSTQPPNVSSSAIRRKAGREKANSNVNNNKEERDEEKEREEEEVEEEEEEVGEEEVEEEEEVITISSSSDTNDSGDSTDSGNEEEEEEEDEEEEGESSDNTKA